MRRTAATIVTVGVVTAGALVAGVPTAADDDGERTIRVAKVVEGSEAPPEGTSFLVEVDCAEFEQPGFPGAPEGRPALSWELPFLADGSPDPAGDPEDWAIVDGAWEFATTDLRPYDCTVVETGDGGADVVTYDCEYTPAEAADPLEDGWDFVCEDIDDGRIQMPFGPFTDDPCDGPECYDAGVVTVTNVFGELVPVYEALQPARLLDTRVPGATVDGEFQELGTRVADSEPVELVVAGRGGVPDDASAVVLNVTVVEAGAAGFVSVWPCDEERPDASSLNFFEGQTVPNAVVSKVSADGTVCLFNAQADVDLLADVNGFFPAGSEYGSLQPARLLDTRVPGATVDGEFQELGTRVADSEPVELVVAGRGGVPDDASAVVLNVTVVEAGAAGFVSVWPCDEERPDTSSLNFFEGQTVPNAVVSKVSADGTVCLFNAQADVDLLADVNGFFP